VAEVAQPMAAVRQNKGILLVLAQSVLFIPVQLAHSHQQIQETCNA
jgi:hypothetical protein